MNIIVFGPTGGTGQLPLERAIETGRETRGDVGWLARNVLFGFLLRNEVADKEAMERHLGSTDLDWIVVRVSRLTNAAARGAFRVADDRSIHGMGKIARSDVADFMLAQLQSNTWLRRKLVIAY
jgi:hypothetical protein